MVLAQNQGILFVSLCPLQHVGWVGQETTMGHWWDTYLELAKGIFCTRSCQTQQHNWPGCCLGIGWASVCLWEVVTGCLCITFFPHFLQLLSCLDQWVFLGYVLPVLFPVPLGCGTGEKSVGMWVLSCCPGSTHHSCRNSVVSSTKAGRNVVVKDICGP